MNYNPPTWRPPLTAGSKSTRRSTTTRRTTTRTSPQPRPTSALTTSRKPVQWTRYNWTTSPTTVTTTTRTRTTKRTTRTTTTTRIEPDYDDFYGDSSGAPATASGKSHRHWKNIFLKLTQDCFDFYFYNDDGVQLTQEECLAVVQKNKWNSLQFKLLQRLPFGNWIIDDLKYSAYLLKEYTLNSS